MHRKDLQESLLIRADQIYLCLFQGLPNCTSDPTISTSSITLDVQHLGNKKTIRTIRYWINPPVGHPTLCPHLSWSSQALILVVVKAGGVGEQVTAPKHAPSTWRPSEPRKPSFRPGRERGTGEEKTAEGP